MDRYGPRICSLVSTFLIMAGFAMFSISYADGLPLFNPAMCLIAFGGPGVQSAIIHVSNLMPDYKSSLTALITGCFQLSFCIFYIFDQIWFYFNWDYRTLFMSYCTVCVSNMIVAALVWPDKPYELSVDNNESDSYKLVVPDEEEETLTTKHPFAPKVIVILQSMPHNHSGQLHWCV